MSLHLPAPPSAALRVVRTALDSPTARRASRIPALQVPGARLTASQALGLHRLDLAAGRPSRPADAPPAGLQAAARPVGWRFTVRSGEEAVAAAETMDTPDGAAFAQFCTGPFVPAAARALRQARMLPQVRTERYEPRLLSVPDLYMMALWLHRIGRSGGEDLLVPLAPAPPGFVTHRPHRVGELLPVLAERAALRMLAGTG